MAAGRDIRAGRAFVELLAKENLGDGLRKAEKKLKAWGATLRGAGLATIAAGTAIVAPFAAAAGVFASAGDQIAKASDRTGAGVEELGALGYAAEQSGASFETLEGGLRKMQQAISKAAAGSPAAADALAQVGLSAEQLDGKSPVEQMKMIADGLASIQDPAARTSAAIAILGRSGAQLIPLLGGGAAAVEELMKRAEELNVVISKEDSAEAVKFGDAMADVWKQVKMVTFQVGAGVADAILPYFDAINKCMSAVIGFVKEHRVLVAAVATAGLGLIVLGGALVGVGAVLTSLGAIAGAAAAVIGAIGTVLGVIISPIGLVTAAIIAGAAAVLYYSGAWDAIVKYLGEAWATLKADAIEAFGGIADALSAGDIQLAAQILWAYLKLEWQRGVSELNKVWQAFKAGFLSASYDAFYGALEAWTIVKAKLSSAWIELTAGMKTAWALLSAGIQSIWESTINAVEDRIHDLWKLWDSGYDADAAKAMADKASAGRQKQIEAEKNTALTGVEADRKKEQAANDKAKTDKLAELSGKNQAANDAIDQAAQQALDASASEVDRLRQQLADLRTAAAAEVTTNQQAELDRRTAEIDQAAAQAEKPILQVTEARGTFNPFAIQGLAGGEKWAEKTAQNTDKIAKSVERIQSRIETADGLEFD